MSVTKSTTSASAASHDADPFASRRAYPRFEVALPAFLLVEGERSFVRLLDLSAGGAKLDCQASLPTGTSVMLDCGMLCRAAVVRWKNDGVLGISFETELDERDLFALVERSRALATRMKPRD